MRQFIKKRSIQSFGKVSDARPQNNTIMGNKLGAEKCDRIDRTKCCRTDHFTAAFCENRLYEKTLRRDPDGYFRKAYIDHPAGSKGLL